jgi:hemolysin activation/secretion protein
LSAISLVTSSYAFGPHLHYPALRSRLQSLYIDAGLSLRAADVTALNQPLSHDNWRTFDASISYINRGWLAGTSSLGIAVTQGLPILGATPNRSSELSRPGAATDFTKVSFSAQRLQRIFGPVSLLIRLQGQYAFAPLIAGEQISFGGDGIGRGYDPSTLLGDHGIGGGLEFRYDHRFDHSWLKSVEPYGFFDAGWIWNRLGTTPGNDRLASAGGGVRVDLAHNVSAGIELAKIIRSVADYDGGLKPTRVLFDLGIHL